MSELINTKIAGVIFDNEDGTSRQNHIKKLKEGDVLILELDDNNPYDSNAVRLLDKDENVLGFIKKTLASDIRAGMDKGWMYKAKVSAVTGQDQQTAGCNILIEAKKEGE